MNYIYAISPRRRQSLGSDSVSDFGRSVHESYFTSRTSTLSGRCTRDRSLWAESWRPGASSDSMPASTDRRGRRRRHRPGSRSAGNGRPLDSAPVEERSTNFGGLCIRYGHGVLEPRGWTLQQARWAVAGAGGAPAGSVLELCAGVGHIGLVVAQTTGRTIVQVDVDPRACAWARTNASAAGVVSDVRCGPFGQVLADGERFPVILADPPYIPSRDTARYPDDPRLAIDGGPDGLAVARDCLTVIGDHLVEGGFAILQLRDTGQVEALTDDVRARRLVTAEQRVHQGRGVLVRLERG